MDSEEVSGDKTLAARPRLTRWQTIERAREKRIGNEIHVGGMDGMETACT